MPGYSHLLDEEQDHIAAPKAADRSIGAIAKAVGRAKSTVSRELRRNALPSGRSTPPEPIKPDDSDYNFADTRGFIDIPESSAYTFCAITAYIDHSNGNFCQLSRGETGQWKINVSNQAQCRVGCVK